MFLKVNVPVLGIVENMAVHICSACGHGEHIFGDGGGAKVAADYDTKLLGSLPLDLSIREQGDLGVPAAKAFADTAIAQQYRDIATVVIDELQGLSSNSGPEIIFE
jgi:ATP-binding protein involved in chromosome partitioning